MTREEQKTIAEILLGASDRVEGVKLFKEVVVALKVPKEACLWMLREVNMPDGDWARKTIMKAYEVPLK